jgi:hypothetical protein
MDISGIVEYCREHDYMYYIEGENPRALIFGEGAGSSPTLKMSGTAHGVDSLEGEEGLIKIVNPNIILHECASGPTKNNPYAEYRKRIQSWRRRFSVPVRGCDIPESRKRGISIEKLVVGLKDLMDEEPDLNGSWGLYLRASSPFREQYMGLKVVKALKMFDTVFCGVGNSHAFPSSRIYPTLRAHKVPFVAVLQAPMNFATLVNGIMFDHYRE